MTGRQQLPDWRDPELGARIRVALWLVQEVGEGNSFNKQRMRRDIDGIEQVDRRMRDLRPAGWVIKTYRDMATLSPDELFLEKIGTPVWEPGQRSAGLRSVSAKLRREILERDGHRCVRCGVAAGEEYPGEPGSRARLTLGHVNPHKHGSGAHREDLLTECARCNEAAKHLTGVQFSEEQVWDQIIELPRKEKTRLLTWMAADRRPLTRTEDAWARYRQLPASHRDELRKRLGRTLGSEG
jgi:5-methylcytosine-specific restriction endonuclease McrA